LDRTLFFHGITLNGNRFTIAGKVDTLFECKKGFYSIIKLGASLCSKNDVFIKKLGRIKAEGRLKSASNKGTENYFVGNKINIFIEECSKFNNATNRQFKLMFNL